MNDSGLWKRGLALLALVGLIAGVALYVALHQPASADEDETLAQGTKSPDGWLVRYNATLALARRGHLDTAAQFATLSEMMNEHQQMVNFAVCQDDGKLRADEAAARSTVYNALQAVAKWYRHPERKALLDAADAEAKRTYEAGLEKLTLAVTQLTESANQALRTEAIRTLQVLQSK